MNLYHATREFVYQITKPTYIWRMATGVENSHSQPMRKSARTRMLNAARAIERAARDYIWQLNELPERCTNPYCRGEKLSWTLDRIKNTQVADGMMQMRDVNPALVLGCDECSETILIIEDGDVVNRMLSR